MVVSMLTGCSISKVMRVEDRQVIPVETMLSELHGSPLLFIGERHDTPSHHEVQLKVIESLKGEGQPVAIGMEMFETSSQGELDQWSAGRLPELDFRGVFERNWRNIGYPLYRDILVYARDKRLPVLALNPPREIVQKVARSGFASLTEAELGLLPKGIDATVDDAYLQFISSAYAFHGRNGDSFRYLCEAQMLRNRVMARRLTDYLALHPGTVMVVLVGGGHARRQGGIPAEIEKVGYKIVLPTIPALTSKTVTRTDGDYLMEEPFSWLDIIF
ncbi:MAG TPA: ChaN family lipoprotein [Geomonas sp.]|nr:ChaN family lipoprotein [Geomonas sp.]